MDMQILKVTLMFSDKLSSSTKTILKSFCLHSFCSVARDAQVNGYVYSKFRINANEMEDTEKQMKVYLV